MATTLPAALAGDLDVLIIDNFDSFTWNLYQQLCLLGAEVTVIRNDAISPSLFPQLKIKSLIVSPGPGHPQTDSGISKDAIEFFQGKVPILGVCMGLECFVDLYGGKIGYAGEIMHGKVSRVRHDDRGCFRGVPQNIQSTRYHSLSAEHTTLPSELAITAVSEDSGVIMGVRHRKFVVEAVQYHPESILSEGGDDLIRNFLSLHGGLWEQNPQSNVLESNLPPFPVEALPREVHSKPGTAAKIPSILEKIHAQRLEDVSKAQLTPGCTFSDLQTLLSLNVPPSITSFVSRIKQTGPGRPSLLAEIKRASPSKGPISVDTSPASKALSYALAGAHSISVLTEPKWFLGSLADMLHVRLAIANLPNRPAVLRKDFILSRYQVLESRIWGADTILLIVSMLSEVQLKDLYAYSLELGMEPLVEVNNAKEMAIALDIGAKVIGVNNRNLHDFNVDMNTTSRLRGMVKGKEVVLCALSGISKPEDVERYASEGINAVLIGESLMRAQDTAKFIRELLAIPEQSNDVHNWRNTPPLIKICGIRSKEEALGAAGAGADMLGLMFVQKSKRFINMEVAREISQAIRELRFSSSSSVSSSATTENAPWFTSHANRLSNNLSRPLLVGVFQNTTLDEVLRAVTEAQLDMVQFHGSEPFEWAHHVPVPVIRAFHMGGEDSNGLKHIAQGGGHQFILLDSIRDDGSGESGGSGKVVDWDLARKVADAGEIVLEGLSPLRSSTTNAKSGEQSAGTQNGSLDHILALATPKSSTFPLPIILAGGLTPSNVAEAVQRVHPWAVDVSGGVEVEGGKGKDLVKVKLFIENAKGIKTLELNDEPDEISEEETSEEEIYE